MILRDPGLTYKVVEEPNDMIIDRETLIELLFDVKSMKPELLASKDSAVLAKGTKIEDATRGGIDWDTSNGMQWKVSKDGRGVEMDVNPTQIAHIRREGIEPAFAGRH